MLLRQKFLLYLAPLDFLSLNREVRCVSTFFFEALGVFSTGGFTFSGAAVW